MTVTTVQAAPNTRLRREASIGGLFAGPNVPLTLLRALLADVQRGASIQDVVGHSTGHRHAGRSSEVLPRLAHLGPVSGIVPSGTLGQQMWAALGIGVLGFRASRWLFVRRRCPPSLPGGAPCGLGRHPRRVQPVGR